MGVHGGEKVKRIYLNDYRKQTEETGHSQACFSLKWADMKITILSCYTNTVNIEKGRGTEGISISFSSWVSEYCRLLVNRQP